MKSPPLVKYRRCFYEMVKEHMNPSRPHTLGLWQLGHVPYFILANQLLVVAYIMYKGFPPAFASYEKYDVLLAFCHFYSARFDAFIPLLMWLFVILYHVLEYLTWSIDVSKETWVWWYQLAVVNQDQYYECRLAKQEEQVLVEEKVDYYEDKLKSSWLGNVLSEAKVHRFALKPLATVAIYFNMENVDQERLFSRPLPAMPNLSVKVRKRVLLNMLVYDALVFGLQIIVVIIYFLFIIVNAWVYTNWSVHPIPARVYILIEISCTFYGTQRMIRYIIFYIGACFFGCIIYTGQALEARKSIEKVMQRCFKNNSKLIPLSQKGIVDHALAEHVNVCNLVLSGDDQLYGKLVFTFIITMVPVNIYFVRRIIFTTNTAVDNMIIWFIVIIVLLLAFLCLTMLSWCCSVYHSPKKFIPKLQQMMRGPMWRETKLKFDDLYGRLMRGPKVALSIGPLGDITYLGSFELLLSYIAYLLMAFNQIISGTIM